MRRLKHWNPAKVIGTTIALSRLDNALAMNAALRERFAVAWYRLVASDPGLTRLALAARATATAVLALAIMAALGRFLPLPLAASLLGVVIALIASVMVNDTQRAARQTTTLLLPLPAALAITLGAALGHSPIAGDGAFVVIVSGAVYVRRFGPRGFAIGMLSFISYFFSLFLHAQFAQLPWLMLAVVLGIACAYTLRFLVFPDRPERRLQSLLRAFYARVVRVLDAVIEALGAPERRAIRRRVISLNEAALMVEAELEDLVGFSRSGVAPALALFDLELAVERIAGLSRDALTQSDRAKVLSCLRRLRAAAVANHRDAARASSPALPMPGSARWKSALKGLAIALERAAGITGHSRSGPDTAPPKPDPQQSGPSGDRRGGGGQKTTLLPTTRQAIQVAVAASLAIVAGQFVSPQRWYWAAITAFVIFAGTSSRGEILAKGWQRVAGTIAGVGAGIGVAVAVNGNAGLSLALIFVCIFAGFYFIQISYGLMIFWVTIALALLYGLLGLFSVHLLALRLEETAVGAAIGVVVASLLLPTRTRTTVRDASRDYLANTAALCTACAEQLTGAKPSPDSLARARALDRDFLQLRTAARPLTHDIAGAFGRHSARRWLRAMLAARYYSRRLARLAHRAAPIGGDTALAAAFNETAAHIEANICALTAAGPKRDAAAVTSDAFDRAAAALGGADEHVMAAARCLRRIERLTVHLERDFASR